MSDYEERVAPDEISMVQQLGTNVRFLKDGNWDMRLLSYIVPPEKIPSSFKPILYAITRKDVVINKKRFWESLADNYLTLINSLEGRGQNNIIRAENANKGIPVHIEPPPEKPGIADRLLGRENVQEYERWKERKAMGIE